jgi:hypothetical protein
MVKPDCRRHLCWRALMLFSVLRGCYPFCALKEAMKNRFTVKARRDLNLRNRLACLRRFTQPCFGNQNQYEIVKIKEDATHYLLETSYGEPLILREFLTK